MSAKSVTGTYVAGHRGLVGSAVVRALASAGESSPTVRTRAELDLLDGEAVRRFFAAERPARVVLAAVVAGGIHVNNSQRWRFIHENLAIQSNVIAAALEHEVQRLVFLRKLVHLSARRRAAVARRVPAHRPARAQE